MLPKRFVPMHCVGRHTIPKQNGSTPVTFWRPVNVRCRVQQDAMQMDVNQILHILGLLVQVPVYRVEKCTWPILEPFMPKKRVGPVKSPVPAHNCPNPRKPCVWIVKTMETDVVKIGLNAMLEINGNRWPPLPQHNVNVPIASC